MTEPVRSFMGIFDTVTDVMEGSTQRAPGNAGDDGSEGSYWCDDCGVRAWDVHVDAAGSDRDGAGTPARSDCGESKRL
jgi:hypothetical protein